MALKNFMLKHLKTLSENGLACVHSTVVLKKKRDKGSNLSLINHFYENGYSTFCFK